MKTASLLKKSSVLEDSIGRPSLMFAFAYKVLGVPIAAGVLYPFFGLLLSPMIASAAMTMSSLSVVGNALRVRTVRL